MLKWWVSREGFPSVVLVDCLFKGIPVTVSLVFLYTFKFFSIIFTSLYRSPDIEDNAKIFFLIPQ